MFLKASHRAYNQGFCQVGPFTGGIFSKTEEGMRKPQASDPTMGSILDYAVTPNLIVGKVH